MTDAQGRWHVRPGYWFKPKLLGFGATPVTWAGWIATLVFAGLLVADTRWVKPDWLRIVLAVVLLASFVVLAWIKTDGGWQWRWGWEKK